MTLVPQSSQDEGDAGPSGLMLWALDDRAVDAGLRAAFSKGRWIQGVPLLFPDRDGVLRVAQRDGWWLDAGRAAAELATLPLSFLAQTSASVALWALAAKWVVERVAAQEVVPALMLQWKGEGWRAQWRVAPVRVADRRRLLALAQAMPGAARAFPLNLGATGRSDAHGIPASHLEVHSAVSALQTFVDLAADGLMRAATALETPQHPPGTPLTWPVRLAMALAGPDDAFELHGVIESHIPDKLTQWVASATELGAAGRPLVGFRIAEPTKPRGPWLLSYHLHTDAGDEQVAAADLGAASQRAIVGKMVQPEATLIEALGRCAGVFAPIGRSLKQKLPNSVSISATEAWEFITDKGMQLERAGYVVELPAALSKVGQRRVRARMRLGVEDAAAHGPGLLAGAVNFRWEASLGDDTLTENEFQQLVRSKAPLVHHRGQWIALDPGDVTRLQALIGEGQGQLAPAEALRLALGGDMPLSDTEQAMSAEIVCEGAFREALKLLRAGGEVTEESVAAPPRAIQATLRPYQLRGFAWLRSTTDLGFGACLADDMGLGKTVQLLSLFADLVERETVVPRASPGELMRLMVICPTSVLGNWRREITRFFPRMGVVLHHGPSRAHTTEELLARMAAAAQPSRDGLARPVCLLTSYALGRRDRELLGAIRFECLALDEAQNIKNHHAAQSQAVRQLSARRRVALTGTPVENRLSELWSVVDFLNPGLLGGPTAFRRRFAIPIERYGDEEAAELLRRVTAPFLLRRMKTDPAVAADLPEKIELTRYCPLTREQAALYQSTLDRALEGVRGLAPGATRRGRVLALITQIKQICNHPAQFLGDRALGARRSGKLQRLIQLLDEVRETGGAALVFTQYREMGHILEEVLAAHLGTEVPFLHGGLERGRRDELVQAFQTPGGPPVLLVSLRAGGTGLNLTRANHVFHYDRWWNPAVEDQATDRAFRIGQTRDVTVHRLVSQGTLEEQIHQILEDKRNLATKVIDAGETWLSDLDDDALRALVELGQDAMLDDGDEGRSGDGSDIAEALL